MPEPEKASASREAANDPSFDERRGIVNAVSRFKRQREAGIAVVRESAGA